MTAYPKVPKPIKPRQLVNEWILKVYAGALLGLILLFALLFWGRLIAVKCRCSSSPTLRRLPGFRTFLKVFRWSRSYAARQIAGFPSLGHALLTATYLGVNLILSTIKLDLDKLSNPAARLGWMTAANITLAVFFGLRNTPMRQLTTETYNRLNFLHRIVGYTAIAQVLLHATLYLTRFVSQNRWRVVLERPNLEGIISSVGMIILLAGIIRHQNYEVFYVSHVLGAVVTILFAALHRPFWLERLPIIMVIAATMWGFDRLLRGACLLSNLYNNTATLYPLPDGGVRLVLKNAPASFSPGLHCFVWIPSIKPFETHPFTIVSNTSSGLELVLKTHAGFTKDLYKHTISDPGRAIKASVEGPYGSLPDLQHFERIIFIAGGSGAAFTFGLANKLLSQIEPGSPQLVDFIWTVRKKENLTWFISHLDELRSHPSRVNVVLHVTGESFVNTPVPCTSSPGSSTPLLLASRDFTSQISRDEPTEFLQRLLKTRLDSPGEEENDPLRDETFESMDLDNRFDVRYKRMRVCKVIHETVESVGTNQRLLIATCGPKSLIADVMNTAGECISSDGPSIEVHCESFDL